MSTEKLVIVSGDGHAEMPHEEWAEYIDPEFRDDLPVAIADADEYVGVISIFNDFETCQPGLLDVIDEAGTWKNGRFGAADVDIRLAEMDREGIACEMVFWGILHGTMCHPFLPMSQPWSRAHYAAAGRAWDRWIVDKFGTAPERLLLCGDAGAGVDIAAMTAQVHWNADHGHRATYLPMFMARDDLPPLSDPAYDPFWAACAERGLVVVSHAGYGNKPGGQGEKIKQFKEVLAQENGIEVLVKLVSSKGLFHRAYEPLQAVWQLLLGGVFDRFPDLKLMLTEVRGDWWPEMLTHLDTAYDRVRADVPARRRPSDTWREHGLHSLSFVHKCEVPMRHEIGIDNMVFGRDYPHAEGTWPNTKAWLRDAFAGVPEPELRAILGENAIRFFGLDPTALQKIANRIGFTADEILGSGPAPDPRMLESWNMRAGYLAPAEHAELDQVDALLAADPVLHAMAR